MSKRKKLNVQSATEKKPEDANVFVKGAEVLSETPSPEPTPAPTVKALPISLEGISADKIKMAEDLGIPVTQIIQWMGSVEERFKVLKEQLPQKIQDSFRKVIEDAQKQQQPAASSENVGAGGGGVAQLMQLLGPMLGGGGSNAMQDKILDMALEGLGLGNALIKAIIVRTAPEMATTLLKPYEKKEGT